MSRSLKSFREHLLVLGLRSPQALALRGKDILVVPTFDHEVADTCISGRVSALDMYVKDKGSRRLQNVIDSKPRSEC